MMHRQLSLVVPVCWLLGNLTPYTYADDGHRAQVRTSIKKSVALLERTTVKYTKHRKCFSCHHQAIPAIALTTAKAHGFQVNEEALKTIREFTLQSLKRGKKRYVEGRGQGGGADTAGYALMTLDVLGVHEDELIGPITSFLIKRNAKMDHWRPSANRPPSEVSRFTTTFLVARALKRFGAKDQKPKIEERLRKALAWIKKTNPKTTEDRVFRLWSLSLLKANRKIVRADAKELLRGQRKDGGWSQTDSLKSDAYATGTALVVLHRTGHLAVDSDAYHRGVDFLVNAQKDDGSWHVKSRSKPFQLYFESGYPHGKDQFISTAAGSWATAAMTAMFPKSTAKK